MKAADASADAPWNVRHFVHKRAIVEGLASHKTTPGIEASAA